MFHLPGSKSSGTSSEGRTQGKSASSAEAGKGKGKKIAQLPDLLSKKQGRTRACMICSLIKTETEFEEEGCDNCEDFLQLARQKGSVSSYTSANFEGMIAMISPEDSWVAKRQRIVHLKPGVYAINVRGEVKPWIITELKDAGKQYINRDLSMSSKAKKKPEEPRPKLSKSRRVSVDSDSADDGAGDEENDATAVPAFGASAVAEKTDETEETFGEDGVGEGGQEKWPEVNEETQEAPSCSSATITIKMEPSDTASVVSGSMSYGGGRRYSDSSRASDDENENKD